jgi:hypothetical protein
MFPVSSGFAEAANAAPKYDDGDSATTNAVAEAVFDKKDQDNNDNTDCFNGHPNFRTTITFASIQTSLQKEEVNESLS